MRLHPAARLLLWAASVVVLQSLSGYSLRFAVPVLALIATIFAPRRAWRLLKRVRWLLVALVVIFAWSTPGRLFWPDADWASPTVEGLALAFDHGARLLGLLMLVALLLEHTPRESLLSGLYALLKPVTLFGADRARAAMRLGLVLRYTDQTLPRRHWREWLHSGQSSSAGETVRLVLHPFGLVDMVAIAATTVLCLWIWAK